MDLYRLTDRYMRENTTFYPRIPINSMTRNGYEDNHTARVCFSPSIQECLMALSQKNTNKSFFVYVPNVDERRLKRMITHPNKKQVPDVELTNEIWVLKPIPVVLIGSILVTGSKKERGFPYTYGNGQEAELYQWNYQVTWINAKKGINYHGLQQER